MYCRAVLTKNNTVDFTGPMADGHDIQSVINDDKQYGVFSPRNGSYFTFRILDTHNEEVSEKMLDRAVKLAFKSWMLHANITVKKAKPWEEADFRIIFRNPINDERKAMTDSTIMYQYFPISAVDHPLRGLCVINPDFYYSVDGKPVKMYLIDPDHYTETDVAMGFTIDLDAVLRHEFGHGFGLPHDPVPHSTMSTPYSFLNEFLAERDIFRIQAKYGYRKMKPHILKRWYNWIRRRSEYY